MPSVNIQYFATVSETFSWIKPGIERTPYDLFVVVHLDRTRQVFSRFDDIDPEQTWLLYVGFRADVPPGKEEHNAGAFAMPLIFAHIGKQTDETMGESRISTRSEPPVYDDTRKIAGRVRRRTKTGLTVCNTLTGDQGVSSFLRYSPGAEAFTQAGGQLVLQPGIVVLVPDPD